MDKRDMIWMELHTAGFLLHINKYIEMAKIIFPLRDTFKEKLTLYTFYRGRF